MTESRSRRGCGGAGCILRQKTLTHSQLVGPAVGAVKVTTAPCCDLAITCFLAIIGSEKNTFSTPRKNTILDFSPLGH